MPIFEYKCLSCGHVLEVLAKSHRDQAPACPKCEKGDMKRLLSGFAVSSGRPDHPTCESCTETTCQSGGCGGMCPM